MKKIALLSSSILLFSATSSLSSWALVNISHSNIKTKQSNKLQDYKKIITLGGSRGRIGTDSNQTIEKDVNKQFGPLAHEYYVTQVNITFYIYFKESRKDVEIKYILNDNELSKFRLGMKFALTPPIKLRVKYDVNHKWILGTDRKFYFAIGSNDFQQTLSDESSINTTFSGWGYSVLPYGYEK